MNKFTINLIISFFCILFFASVGSAKSPPPGTGVADVKANILIMLDKSGSMGWAQSTPDLRGPVDVAVNSAGLVHVLDYASNAVKIFGTDGTLLHTINGNHYGPNPVYGRARQRHYLYTPMKILVDKYDNYWVLNKGRYEQGEILKFNSSNRFVCSFSYGVSYRPGIVDSIATDSQGRIFIKQDRSSNVLVVKNDCNFVGMIETRGGSTMAINSSDEIFLGSYRSNGLKKITNWDRFSNFQNSGTPISSWIVKNFSYIDGDIGYGKDCNSNLRGLIDIEFTDDGTMYGLDYYCNKMVKISGPTGSSWSLDASFGSKGSGTNQWDDGYGFGTDINASGNNLFVADYQNQRVLKYNASTTFASYDTKIGTSFNSMDMAKRVIKAIMRNSSITDGANFGLMEWSCNYKVRVNVSDTGAQEILADIDKITTGGGTCLGRAMEHAENYFQGSSSPIDPNISCENTYIIVISDGVWQIRPNPNSVATRLLSAHDIKTYAVGFLNYGNKSNYQSLATAGGTKTPLYADDENALLQKLTDTLSQVVASNQTFTAPTISSDLSQGDFIYQSLFNYKTSSQWEGHLNKYKLKADGSVGSLVWDAGAQLNSNSESSRQIWTVGDSYPSGLNNFTSANVDYLKSEMYYRVTQASDSDAKKLINFIRGVDSYDEDKDGNTTEGRWKLGDIYHSELAIVTPPSADASSTNIYTESYYRQNNNYYGFKNSNNNRSNIVLAGANDGMLHAFNASSGKELWAFIPPSLLQKLRTVISSKANTTNSIFGVDGNPVVKDIYYNNKWRTIALTGLGKGGNSYFALDITDVNNPKHLFTVLNDPNFKEVSYWDSSGEKTVYSYNSTFFPNNDFNYSKLGEAWSTPRILRMKINKKDKWVGVFGGGFNNAVSAEYGSAVFIIDLENGGKILKKIDVADKSGNNIINSLPSAIIPITADGTALADYHGAMTYFADYEGKLWKLNLTDKGNLYDMQEIFDSEATGKNGRRVMKDVVASIDTNNKLWFYYGTGNQQQLQKISPLIKNRLYGIKDDDFPKYKMSKANNPAYATCGASCAVPTVSQCRNVTSVSASCPTNSQKGWYIDLKANEKTTSRATVSNRTVYFSRYIPNDSNPCVAGNAFLTSHDYRCGNVLQNISLGTGVATDAVIFKGKIYIGLSGATTTSGTGTSTSTQTITQGWIQKDNLIVGTAPPGRGSSGTISVESWRHIF